MAQPVKNLITLPVVTMIRDKAIEYFNKYPVRCRLAEMTRDLTEDEKRILAHYEASMLVMRALGLVDDDTYMAQAVPLVHTEVQEVIDEQQYRYTEKDPSKK